MAKKQIIKAQAIRDFHKQNPDVGPTEAAQRLTAKHGVEFTASAVSACLTQERNRNGKANATTHQRPSEARQQATTQNPVDCALTLIKSAGGLQEAEAVLAQIRKIKETV